MPEETGSQELRRSLLGSRDRPQIGLTPQQFRSFPVITPSEEDLAGFSSNPRNMYGDWYEQFAGNVIDRACSTLNLRARTRERIRYVSPVYVSGKVVDKVVENNEGRLLGFELKYLHGDGSLVKPKALIDAIDFTNRPFDCLYLVDGPGWLLSRNVEYLYRWWSFTSTAAVESTLRQYFVRTSGSRP